MRSAATPSAVDQAAGHTRPRVLRHRPRVGEGATTCRNASPRSPGAPDGAIAPNPRIVTVTVRPRRRAASGVDRSRRARPGSPGRAAYFLKVLMILPLASEVYTT